jgi:hypothetical protein
MDALSAVAHYAALLFGVGLSLGAIYQIGRMGSAQYARWLSGLFRSDCLGHFLGYLSSLLGGKVGFIWIWVGLPCVLLSVALHLAGYHYWPEWLERVGIHDGTRALAALLALGVAAYVAGTAHGSRQQGYNGARLCYEEVVRRKGYWFDRRGLPGHYAEDTPTLERCLATFEQLLAESRERGSNQEIERQQMMALHYQMALIYCTLGRLDAASAALEQSRRFQKSLAGTNIWDPGEEDTFESQLLFLEGEIAFAEGRTEDARGRFEASLRIDERVGDADGVAKNRRRLGR